jgi:hypothetical protein
MAKSVSFSSIEIIEIERTIGDNPSVQSGGVPLSLEWDAHTKITLDLDHFEQIRPPTGPVRRLSPRSRRKLLLKKGFSDEVIDAASLEASKTRRERVVTVQQLNKLGALKSRRRAPASRIPYAHSCVWEQAPRTR